MHAVPTISRAAFFDYRVLPERTQMILTFLSPERARTSNDLLAEYPSTARDAIRHITDTMRALVDTGLAHRDTTRGVSYFQLTEMGQRLIYEQTARSLLYADLMHYLFFALSDEPDHNGTVSGWSWVYQTTCRLLWNARPLVPTPTKLAADLNHLLADAYPDHSGGVHPNGPRGVLAWLRALQPPFTRTYGTTQRASGRSWCSPELLMLGVARLYHQKDVPFGTPLLLDAQAMEELSALCLAEAPCLEDVLEVCLATFPFLTTHSGEWGRSAPRA